MPRRVSLPAADELFRTTGGSAVQPSAPQGEQAAPTDGARAPSPGSGADREAAQEHPQGDAASGGAARSAPPAGRGRGAVPGQNTGPEAAERRRGAVPQVPQAARPPSGAGGARVQAPSRRSRAANRRPSGRERHDEKITVYVSAEELMDLEHARLVLRGEHGLAVDRGRIVREAVAVVLADLESRGDASILVRRLRGR